VPPLFWPAVFLPLSMLVLGFAYPFVERRLSGDRRRHNILDRPRNVPVRTAFGCSVIAFWIVLMIAGSDDVISWFSDVPIEWIVNALRVLVFLVPAGTFVATHRLCVALQVRERRREQTGAETGLAIRMADGSYAEITEVSADGAGSRQPAQQADAVPRAR
jgi:ubiquinol-cytochrome c reductase cytochrome b subunit